MKLFYSFVLVPLFCCAPAFATVIVSSPSNGATVGTNVKYNATANTTTCSAGVAAMGVYVDNKLNYVANGTTLNTTLPLGAGVHQTVVEEWDYCGGATFTPLQITVSNQTGLSVSSPMNNGYVSYLANYTASASSPCPQGVAAMGVYINNQLVYVSQGSSLNTMVTLPQGNPHTVVEEWDYCGGASYTPIDVNVVGTTLWSLQSSGGWSGYGELAPGYDICTSCSGVGWSMAQHINSTSLSGNATQFNLGGSVPYSDALWTNPVIGQNTTQNIPDWGHTLLPGLHNFTYDTDVYVTNFPVTQNLEFDINMYMNGVGMIWGTQCNHLADGDWDIWNNVSAAWVSIGVPCNLNNNAWNHITIQVQRESDNTLLYQSITQNGVTYNINQVFAPFSVPSDWWGITVNYQMDGNYVQAANTTYLDNFSFTYW
jgi:hypothetical protein